MKKRKTVIKPIIIQNPKPVRISAEEARNHKLAVERKIKEDDFNSIDRFDFKGEVDFESISPVRLSYDRISKSSERKYAFISSYASNDQYLKDIGLNKIFAFKMHENARLALQEQRIIAYYENNYKHSS